MATVENPYCLGTAVDREAHGDQTAQPFQECNRAFFNASGKDAAGNAIPPEVVICCNGATPVDLEPFRSFDGSGIALPTSRQHQWCRQFLDRDPK